MSLFDTCFPHTGSRRQRKGRGDRRTAELASTVRNALEETILADLFPRAQIDVGIQVLQADGSVQAACINAAMLAVADAGAPWCLLCSKVHHDYGLTP